MKTSRVTLFVVDDDTQSRKAVAALALSLKIHCETFASAERFLDRYDPSLTGCALVDYHLLGGMDGLQLQQRLRTMGSTLAVVLISAYADESVAVRALKDGAIAFIEKPYEADELVDAIHKALEHNMHAETAPTGQAEPQQHMATQTSSSSGPRMRA